MMDCVQRHSVGFINDHRILRHHGSEKAHYEERQEKLTEVNEEFSLVHRILFLQTTEAAPKSQRDLSRRYSKDACVLSLLTRHGTALEIKFQPMLIRPPPAAGSQQSECG